MISFRIATELRTQGHDVVAIKRDRPHLESTPDIDIVRQATRESRTIVTNNVKDFMPIHHNLVATNEDHAGILFTTDKKLPRSKKTLGLWVQSLESVLTANPDDDAFKNKVAFL